MRALENRIPPPVVALVVGLLMWALSSQSPAVAAESPIRLIASLSAVILGVVFCLSGVISFKRARTTVNPLKPETASSLVTSGVYQISRNPMYVGFALLLVAWTIYLASPWAFLGVAAFVIYITCFQIIPEERAMTNLFGAEFISYQAKVRRWL